MSQTTSGTVLATRYTQRKILDHAFRKAGYEPEKVTSELLEVAQDLLFVQLAEYISVGYPLWTRQLLLLPINIGSRVVQMPYGTVDAMHVYWRQLRPWRGPAVASTGNSAAQLFGGQPSPDLSIVGPNAGVIVSFGGTTEIDTIGVLPGKTTGYLLDGFGNPILDGSFNPILGSPSSYSAALEVVTSQDGLTYTNVQTLPMTTFKAGVWSYFDLEPTISAPFVRLVLPGADAWTLNQVQFGLANSSQNEMSKQNADDFFDLPNDAYQGGRPNTAFVDRKMDQPSIRIWPTPNTQAYYSGTVVVLARRYIQDPGALTNSLEIPARWIEGVTSRLGVRLMDELPEPMGLDQIGMLSRQQRRANNETAATKGEAIMWSEERSGGPYRIAPNISGYTK